MKHLDAVRREPPLFILLLLVSFASIAAVLFTPALPEITQKLGITSAQAQLTISVFLIGYAFGNLPYGPISNRFGRKRAIYTGITIAIIGSLLVVLVGKFQFFWLFMLGRFLMALGSSVGIKAAFTIIGDVYQNEKATKTISYLMLAFAIGPALAIALGGFLTHNFGWESCFYFLTAYSILLLGIIRFLPETCPQLDPNALNVSQIKEGYLAKLRNKKLVACALIMGCATSFIYIFASEAPFIGIDFIGLSPEVYGLLNFIPPVGMITGSILSHKLAGRKDGTSIIFLGINICLVTAIVMLALFLSNIVNLWSLFLPMPFLYAGQALIFSNSSSMGMTHSKNKSNASAMLHFLNISLSVMILFIIEAIPSDKVFIMPLSFALICVAMLFFRNRLSNLLKESI